MSFYFHFYIDKRFLSPYINCTNILNTVSSLYKKRGGLCMIMLDLSDKRPLYEQITDKFKDLIDRGILQANEQLPSVRSLAMELSINPNTIQRAYSELERLNYIYTVKGKGNFTADISDMLPKRQESFFNSLDELLKKAPSYSLSGEDIKEHVNKFFG